MNRASVESRLAIDPRPAGEIRWEGNDLVFQPSEPWPAGGHIQSGVLAGALSARGLPMLGDVTWAFDVGQPRILYLWPADGPAELYARTLQAEEASRLTFTSGVLDYSLTADGSAAVYSASGIAGSVEIRQRDLSSADDQLLYACPQGITCRAPVLSPDGRWLAFEAHEEDPGAQVAGTALIRVQVLPLEGEAQAVLAAPADHPTSKPAWSSNGWLTYYDHALMAFGFLVAPDSAEQTADLYVPNALGDRGDWSPDGEAFVVPEMVFVPEAPAAEDRPPVFYSHLYRVDVRSGAVLDLSGEGGFLVEDTGPSFSPDGLWLAFSRKYLDRSRWTLGRQIWRMRTDGLAPEPLTDEPSLNHSALAWSPDGQYLVYMVFDQTDMTRPAEVWWMAVDGSSTGQLAVGAYSPQWSP